jgi:hypothetical protein
LTQRAELIENAMKVFETEEDELDLQIAKIRLVFPSLLFSLTSSPELGIKLSSVRMKSSMR